MLKSLFIVLAFLIAAPLHAAPPGIGGAPPARKVCNDNRIELVALMKANPGKCRFHRSSDAPPAPNPVTESGCVPGVATCYRCQTGKYATGADKEVECAFATTSPNKTILIPNFTCAYKFTGLATMKCGVLSDVCINTFDKEEKIRCDNLPPV